MTPEDFTTWLRGFLAALGTASMTAAQAELVRLELAKVAPAYPWTLGPVVPVPTYDPAIYKFCDGTTVGYPNVAGGLGTVCAGTLLVNNTVCAGTSFAAGGFTPFVAGADGKATS